MYLTTEIFLVKWFLLNAVVYRLGYDLLSSLIAIVTVLESIAVKFY